MSEETILQVKNLHVDFQLIGEACLVYQTSFRLSSTFFKVFRRAIRLLFAATLLR